MIGAVAYELKMKGATMHRLSQTLCAIAATRRPRSTVTFALAAVAAFFTIAVLPAAAARAGSSPCGSITGGKWAVGPYTGDKWLVYVTGNVSCTLGKTWVVRITRQPGNTANGPSGWTCKKTPLSGACAHPNSSHQFSWAILAKKP
jgi:hypothetical protein